MHIAEFCWEIPSGQNLNLIFTCWWKYEFLGSGIFYQNYVQRALSSLHNSSKGVTKDRSEMNRKLPTAQVCTSGHCPIRFRSVFKVPIRKECHFRKMKLWRVEHFWTYLSSHLGVIAEYNSNPKWHSFKIGTLAVHFCKEAVPMWYLWHMLFSSWY